MQSAKPSTTPRCIPNPMIGRVYWSMTTSTQYVSNAIDSQRNKSRLQRLSFIWPMNVSHEGPPPVDVGEYCVARILRTTSLLIDVPKAKLICSAICGPPHDGLRRFISITARIKSAVGPFGPGFLLCFGENSKRYFAAPLRDENSGMSTA